MMKGFEPVTLSWQEESYTVPADRVFELVGTIEEILMKGDTVPAVLLLLGGGLPYTRLSRAFGAALRFAGAKVSDEEIYLSVNEQLAKGDMDGAVLLQQANMALLEVISPPFALDVAHESEAEKK